MVAEKAMNVVEKYNGHDIKYIDFANWYTVFIPKGDGTSAMHHFDTPEDAKEFLDTYDKEKVERKFWWDKDND